MGCFRLEAQKQSQLAAPPMWQSCSDTAGLLALDSCLDWATVAPLRPFHCITVWNNCEKHAGRLGLLLGLLGGWLLPVAGHSHRLGGRRHLNGVREPRFAVQF